MFSVPSLFRQLNSASKWLVLWAVYGEPGLTGRKVSERAGLAWAPVKNALDWLTREGFIRREGESRNHRYYPNRDHYLFPVLRDVFGRLEAASRELFREFAASIFPPEAVLVALKISGDTFFFVVRDRVDGLHERLSRELARRGLGSFAYEIVPLEDVRRLREIRELPGVHFGAPFAVLLQAADRARKLAFFTY